MMDDQIVSAVRTGNRNLFGQLIDRHTGMIYAYSRSWLPVDLAEEVTQETFTEAYLSLARYREGEDFGSWVRGICRNLIRNRLRSRRRHKEVALAEACLELEPVSMPPVALEPLSGCIQALDEASQHVVRGFYEYSRTLESIADEMGKTRTSVGVMLHRARLRLRECLRSKGLEGLE